MHSGDNSSSILGWISIACWIVVYSPQVYENYTLKSGEGLSLLFVIVWLLGDLTNLIGAVLGGLLPTVVILALYYTTCDSILLFQIFYYRHCRRRQQREGAVTGVAEERQPLLQLNDGHRERELVPTHKIILRYMSALAFVFAVGISAWWISEEQEEKTGFAEFQFEHHGKSFWAVQILGWSSAALFLGARVPQILKNFKTRCQGLSPALFFFAIFGNTTYALSICAKSMDRDYLITNAGWLAGSILTIFLDIAVLCQFSYYRYMDENEARMTSE